jgi:hypothetical protein
LDSLDAASALERPNRPLLLDRDLRHARRPDLCGLEHGLEPLEVDRPSRVACLVPGPQPNAELRDIDELVSELRELGLTGSEADYSQWARQAELYLRCVRQVDRLAQIDRQLGQPAEPE